MDGDTDKSLKNEIEILQTLLECKYLTMFFGFVIDFSVPSIFFDPVSAAWQEWWTGSTGKRRRRTCCTCCWKGFSFEFQGGRKKLSGFFPLKGYPPPLPLIRQVVFESFPWPIDDIDDSADNDDEAGRGDADLHTIIDNQKKLMLSGESVSLIKIR